MDAVTEPVSGGKQMNAVEIYEKAVYDLEPEWNEDYECWECEKFRDAFEVEELAFARHYDEQEEQGKDMAKGVR